MIGPTEWLGRITVDAINPAGVPRTVAQIDLELDRRQCVGIVDLQFLDSDAAREILRVRVSKNLSPEVVEADVATAERTRGDIGRAKARVVARHLLFQWTANQVVHKWWHVRLSALN